MNHSRIFPHRMYKAPHTSSALTVPFILLSQIFKTMDTTLLSTRSFTDGTASSSLITSSFRLMALGVGITSRPLLANCSLSLLTAIQRNFMATRRNPQFIRWLTISLACTKNYQMFGWNAYMPEVSHKGKQYLAVNSQKHIYKNLNSPVYIWN